MEFEKTRQMVGSVVAQKQQLQMQIEMFDSALKEMKESKQPKVLKVIGNILVEKDTDAVIKDFESKKEVYALKIKTFEKQEETFMKRLNTIKSQIEGSKSNTENSDVDKKDDKKEHEKKIQRK